MLEEPLREEGRVSPQKPVLLMLAFFFLVYYRNTGAMPLSLITKPRKMDDGETSFQDKTVIHRNSQCWQITHHADEK